MRETLLQSASSCAGATALQDGVSPGVQSYIQSRRRYLIPFAVVAGIGKRIDKTPGPALCFLPWQLHPALSSIVAEINHNETSIIVFHPAPGQQVLKACIVGPAATLTQPPCTIAKYRSVDSCEELVVERMQCFVNGLCGASGQKDRYPYLTAFKLAFMEESCPRQSGYRDCCGPMFRRGKGRCGPRLIVVLEEAEQPLLVGKVGTEMKSNTLCIVMFHAIIEPFVVAEVEPLLLQLPLQVPVSFRDETKMRSCSLNGRDDFTPVLGWRPLPRATALGSFENLVQDEHGHVAADAITLGRNTGDGFNRCLPQPGLKHVELQNVRPGREIRVPSAGANVSLYLKVGCWVVPRILSIPANEILGALGDPGVVRRYVVRHEIKQQLHASPRELAPGDGETFRTSEVFINHVASYAVGRSHIVFQPEIGQSSTEIVNQMVVLIGHRNAGRTSFPNAHKPNGIETKPGDGVPFI
jgi:hypothetical protein